MDKNTKKYFEWYHEGKIPLVLYVNYFRHDVPAGFLKYKKIQIDGKEFTVQEYFDKKARENDEQNNI